MSSGGAPASPTAAAATGGPGESRGLLAEDEGSVMMGDLLYLESTYTTDRGGQGSGYLHGDGVCRTRVGLQTRTKDQVQNGVVTANFQECLFRIGEI